MSILEAGLAVIIGASGGIGSALAGELEGDPRYETVLRLSRGSEPAIDLLNEASIQAAAARAGSCGPLRLLLIASGFLHDEQFMPEKSLKQLSAEHLAHAFAVNAIGPGLVLKHFLPLVPREGRCVIAAISAKVGSIGDNELGGWISYRASKAALNQIIRTGAVELRRTRTNAICVAIHPGTVDSRLSAPFAKSGLKVRSASIAATEILNVLHALTPADTGTFRDYRGEHVPW